MLSLIFTTGGFLVGLFALWSTLFGYAGYKARLKEEPVMRDKAARALTAPGPLSAYFRTLEVALDTLTRWMGKRARRIPENGDRGAWGQSFNWCFTFAMIYPFAFLLISWLFGGTGTVGAFEFLPPPESLPDWRRFLLVAYLLSMGAGFFYLGRNLERIYQTANDWLDRKRRRRVPETHPQKATMLLQKAKLLLPICVGAILFPFFYMGHGLPLAAALVLAGALAGAVTAIAFALAIFISLEGAAFLVAAAVLFLAVALAEAVAGEGASDLAAALALAVVIAGVAVAGEARALAAALVAIMALGIALALAQEFVAAESIAVNIVSATFLLFFLLLPIINALFDWASWQVSRWLGDNILTISNQHGYPQWKRAAHYAKDIVFDGGFALACLLGLAWAIPRVIDAFNGIMRWLFDVSIFSIADYLCTAAREPLGDGLLATLMLFTTLLPTATHFSFLIFAPIFWGISWLFGAHLTNHARASHLTNGTKPPKKDTRDGHNRAAKEWSRTMPTKYRSAGLREDQPMFEGHLNETTLHAITMQLCFWRPLTYAAGLVFIGALGYLLASLASSSWRPIPEILLWIAHNFDYEAVRQCFPKAPEAAPFETLAI